MSYSTMPSLMAATEYLPKKQKVMEKSCIWNFKPIIKERKLPKSWEEFCEMFPIKEGEAFIDEESNVYKCTTSGNRFSECDRNKLPDNAIAKAVLALSQLIQLRNAYNGDWVPDWTDKSYKYIIGFHNMRIVTWSSATTARILCFKSAELRDEFLHYFRPLIEKLKPLYGII